MLFQLLISGVATGCAYVLVAHSINIIYASSNVLNFAQGEMLMVGTLLVLTLAAALKIPILVAVPVGLLIASLIGFVLYLTAVLPIEHRKGSAMWLLSTLGFALILRNTAIFVWGRDPHALPPFIPGPSVKILIGFIERQEIIIIFVAVITMIFYELFLRKTMVGRAIKAVSLDHKLSKLMGIDTRKIVFICYGLGAGFVALAGCVLGPLIYIHPEMGFVYALKGFVVVIIGGLGSPFGAVVAGLMVGVLESLAAGYISGAIGDSVAFTLLIMCLVLRPTGIFGGGKLARA
jgi:branched-chain amino acid transport system permease protein